MLGIRYAKITDLEKLDELDRHVPWENMKKCITDGRVIIATYNGEIIGWLRFGYLYDIYPFLNMLFIREKFRNMRIGTRLMDQWEVDMLEKGNRFVYTSTQEDENAQFFYRKRGYTDIGGFTPPGQDALELVLYKDLGEADG
ncbi:MAG: GNAT family N-acetyltransferase [Clostridia bacterium]|nr:GNAT family N-acetyltransferase [Clostridia bacterium]